MRCAPASTAESPVVFTLGHSRHPIADFVALAACHGIETVVDVRGQPWSRFNPQYNREPFRAALAAAGIGYRWEGERLSGRPRDSRFYRPDGGLDLPAVRAWPAFAQGLDEIGALAAETRIALVCAEEDPIRCHRRFLLTPPLIERKVDVRHIRKDGRIETEAAVVARARGDGNARQQDLFG